MSTIFSDLREAIAARLRADDIIKGPPAIEVISFDQSDLDARINKALTQAVGGESAAGICIVIGNVGFEPGESKEQIRATFGVTITENVALNSSDQGSGKRSEDLQGTIYALLCFESGGIEHWFPDSTWSDLTLRDSSIQDVGQQVTYTMTFTATAYVKRDTA